MFGVVKTDNGWSVEAGKNHASKCQLIRRAAMLLLSTYHRMLVWQHAVRTAKLSAAAIFKPMHWRSSSAAFGILIASISPSRIPVSSL
jgi:hypothetical protein